MKTTCCKKATGEVKRNGCCTETTVSIMIAKPSGTCRIDSMMNEAKNEAKHEAKQANDFLPYAVPAIAWDGESRYEVSPFLVFKGVPIHLLGEFKSSYKGAGFTIRWRGPRKHRKDRSRWLRQSVCTREDAVSFSVYYYGR